MSRLDYRLIPSNGIPQKARIGLIDRSGMFLFLLGENETRHFEFSDESACIAEQSKEINELKQALKQAIRDAENEIESYKRKASYWKDQAKSWKKTAILYLEERNEQEQSGAATSDRDSA